MKVGDVMTPGVELVPADATVRDAALVMAEHDIGAVLVGPEGKPAGILTDRDIIIRVVVEGRDPGAVAAGEVMSSTLFTCRDDDPVEAALGRMEERQVRRLPVVDAGGRLVGIVARSDLHRALGSTGAAAAAAPASDPPGAEAVDLAQAQQARPT